MTDPQNPKIEIDWLKTFAGALAAVSSAVLLSTLGAAGTLIGAAIGSVVVTITSALYSQGLARSRAKLTKAQEAALARVGVSTSEMNRAQADLDPAGEDPGEESSEAPKAPLRERLGRLPWKRIAIGAGGLFLVAVLTITAFEVLTGRSVSSYTGGSKSGDRTSLSELTGGRDEQKRSPDRRQDEDPGSTPTSPSSDATPTEPESSEEPTEEPTEESSEGSTEESTEESTVEPDERMAPEAPETSAPVPSAPVPTQP